MKVIKEIFIGILCILMALSFVLGTVVFGLHRALVPTEICGSIISEVPGEYYSQVRSALLSTIEQKMALVIITPEDISEYLTDDVIQKEAEKALLYTVSSMLGYMAEEPVFEDENLLAHIDTLLNKYALESGVEYEEGSAEKVYRMIVDTVNANLRSIPESYVSKVAPITEKVVPLLELWYICPAVWAVLALIVVLLRRREILSALYAISLSSYIGGLVVFVPTYIIYTRDYLSGTVLGDGPFMLIIRGVWNTVVGSACGTAFVCAVAFAVLFFIVLVIRMVKKARSAPVPEN